jgi:tRNA (mo5U34)-methyltransferase
MYPFELTDGSTPPLLHHELPSVHQTRAAVIEPVVRQALRDAGPDATALDLACSEGWFAHQLLDWGAAHVTGIDVRDVNIRRANEVRDNLGLPGDRLRFEVADVYDLTAERWGQFDVVLCLGLVYHLENPVGAIRIARDLTRRLCVIESQLTEQNALIRSGVGVTDQFEELEASFGAKFEPAQSDHPIASFGGVISLVPNRAALLLSMSVAGLRDVTLLPVPADGNAQYTGAHRGVAAGWAPLEAA